MVELRIITKDNIEQILCLKVAQSQNAFVSDTAHSLAQAYAYKETAYPFAIYAEDTLVGFIMMGYYELKNQYTLWKLLIDEKYQNKGYGKQALLLGIEYLRNRFNASEVYLGVTKENTIARQLYYSVGFRETGIADEMKLDLNE